MGLLRAVVHAANVQDLDGGRMVLGGLAPRVPRLAHLWADSAYQGPFARWVTETVGWSVTVVRKLRRWVWVAEWKAPPLYPVGFQVLPRRWVVKRTIGWLNRHRRLSKDKDYDALPAAEEAWVHVAIIGIRSVASRVRTPHKDHLRPWNFTTPIGKVILATLGAFAEYSSANLSAETRKERPSARSRGCTTECLPLGRSRARTAYRSHIRQPIPVWRWHSS